MRKSPPLARIAFASASALAAWSSVARADVKLPAILSDNMCLQANKALPIWGKADPGEQVTVTLGEQKQTAAADEKGNWRVRLQPLPEGAGPLEMKVAGKNTIDVKNIIVGEVWVASGQSNMEFSFHGAHNADEERPKAKYPTIRIFNLRKKIAFEPQWDCVGKWEECTPETVDHTTAVGYFFSRDLHEKLGVPVGLIHTSWGGTPAQAWTSIEDLDNNPDTAEYARQFNQIKDHPVEAKEKYEKDLSRWEAAEAKWTEEFQPQYLERLKAWREEVEAAKAAGKPAPPQPRPAKPEPRKPTAPDADPNLGSVLYNGMIAPIIPYGIEGAIWYQGESNAGNPWQYRTLFPAMIADWRKHWSAANSDEKDFSFLFVQLANFMARQDDPVQDDGGWPGLREAQHQTLKLPNTGEAVIIDIGQADDIHPKDKMDVGKRLALAALHVTYHKDLVYSGPTCQSMTVEGNKVRIKFDNVGAGLAIAAGPSTRPGVAPEQPARELQGFSIAGEDKKFVWADAKIESPDTIVVWSDQVRKPVAVRYAWANNPECNLYNKEGLPASPFRTDIWGGPPVKK